MIKTLEELNQVQGALEDVYGYLTDNSCGDPNCCGGPYYTEEDYTAGLDLLRRFGLEVDI